MTTATPPATIGPAVLGQSNLKDLGWLEKTVGPEWYRLLKGIVTNPLSIIGITIVSLFILMAVFAPVLAPKPSPLWQTTLIPRDGFKPEPQPPGSAWNSSAPQTVPGWYKVIIGKEEWTHILGTTSGQYDIWYGLIWGSRTALGAGSLVAISELLIGMLVGAIAG